MYKKNIKRRSLKMKTRNKKITEVEEYETKDARKPMPILLPQVVNEDIYYNNGHGMVEQPFPKPFPDERDIPTVYTSETVAETAPETVLETLRQEQEQAKNVLEL